MGRIRTVKPEFFLHEELFELEEDNKLPIRLGFLGLWTVCDREGRFSWRPRMLKAQVLPYDEIDFERVLEVLAEAGFIVKYEYGGSEFGYIPSWKKHQVINQREAQSKLPDPNSNETHVHTYALQHKGPSSRRIPDEVRETVFARDNYTCVRCGSKSLEDLTLDHIFPYSMGGTHVVTNLRTLCKSCNSSRPVAGQALIDDLARDGYTLEDMQRICIPVHTCGEGKEIKIGREGKDLKEIAREKTENLESLNLPPNPIPPPALVGNPFVESYSPPVWLRKVFGELYEEATGQFVICSGIEIAKAKEFFSVLSQLNPGADEKEIYERAKLGAEIAFEGHTEGTGYFHWLDKSPPTVGWFANNAPQVNLAVTARLNMTEEEIEQEQRERQQYEDFKAFADEVDAQVEKDLAEGRKPLSSGFGLPKPRTEH